mmetsp:Transcript_28563/g.53544  ORF Transcript_28563/g.53544 Transcript_28563/m.53544 type:complete len:103 (-) Transcript_28563:1072-1380(-)
MKATPTTDPATAMPVTAPPAAAFCPEEELVDVSATSPCVVGAVVGVGATWRDCCANVSSMIKCVRMLQWHVTCYAPCKKNQQDRARCNKDGFFWFRSSDPDM